MATAVRDRALKGRAHQADADAPVNGVADPASDMWAAGAIAWQVFSGRPLYEGPVTDQDILGSLLGVGPLPFEEDPTLWVHFSQHQACLPPSPLEPRKARDQPRHRGQPARCGVPALSDTAHDSAHRLARSSALPSKARHSSLLGILAWLFSGGSRPAVKPATGSPLLAKAQPHPAGMTGAAVADTIYPDCICCYASVWLMPLPPAKLASACFAGSVAQLMGASALMLSLVCRQRTWCKAC